MLGAPSESPDAEGIGAGAPVTGLGAIGQKFWSLGWEGEQTHSSWSYTSWPPVQTTVWAILPPGGSAIAAVLGYRQLRFCSYVRKPGHPSALYHLETGVRVLRALIPEAAGPGVDPVLANPQGSGAYA
jgi:hypothetical protein